MKNCARFLLLFLAQQILIGVASADSSFTTNGTINSAYQDGNTLYIGGDFGLAGKVTGSTVVVNPTTGAIVNSSMAQVAGTTNAIASDGVGGWYVGGSFRGVGNVAQDYLAHIKSDGTLDTSFNLAPDAPVTALLKVGSSLWVAGQFNTIGGVSRKSIAKVNLTTGAVISPNLSITFGGSQVIYALAHDSGTDTLFFGGDFTQVASVARTNLAGIDATTGALRSFAPDPDGVVRTLHIFNGNLYAGGNFTSVTGPTTRNRAASFSLSTGALTAWDPNANGIVSAIVGHGTQIYLAGSFSTLGGSSKFNLGAVDDTTGTTLDAWSPSGTSSYNCLAVMNNILYVGGASSNTMGSPRFGIAAIDISSPTKTLTSFTAHAGGLVLALAVDGTSVAFGGDFAGAGLSRRTALASFDLTTNSLNAWNPVVSGAPAVVRTILPNSGFSTVFIGGSFTSAGGASRTNLAEISTTTGNATSFNIAVGGDGPYSLAQSGTTLYVGGNFTNIGAETLNYLGAIDLTGNTVIPAATFDPNADALVYDLAVDGSDLFLGGLFTSVKGSTRRGIAKINRTTAALDTFDAGCNIGCNVQKLQLDGSSIFVGGSFTTIGGQTRNNLAKLDKSTAVADSSFNPGPNNLVISLGLNSGVLFAGGNFTLVGGLSNNMTVALDPSSGTASSFGFGSVVGNNLKGLIAGSRRFIFGSIDAPNATQPIRYFAEISPLTSTSSASTPSGTAIDGSSLTSNGPTYNGTGNALVSAQWQRCNSGGSSCTNITGQIGNTYTLQADDVGSTIRVNYTAADYFNNASVASPVTSIIAPLSSAAPTISGLAVEGQVLSTDGGGWNGASGLDLTYTWLRCDSAGNSCSAISGATSSTYTITSTDVGSTIRVRVAASKNGSAVTTSAQSSQTGVVTSPTPTPTPTPTPSPTPTTTATPTPTPTASPSASPTASPTPTSTPSPLAAPGVRKSGLSVTITIPTSAVQAGARYTYEIKKAGRRVFRRSSTARRITTTLTSRGAYVVTYSRRSTTGVTTTSLGKTFRI